MDGGAWKAAVHRVAEGRTRLSDFTFTFHFHALEKEMATHSSVLALRIPGMGKPGGLPSMGSHRVGHDWSDLAKKYQFINILDAINDIIYEWFFLFFYIIIYTHMCTVKKSPVQLQHNKERYFSWRDFAILWCIKIILCLKYSHISSTRSTIL